MHTCRYMMHIWCILFDDDDDDAYLYTMHILYDDVKEYYDKVQDHICEDTL